jgi:hypothetical protein
MLETRTMMGWKKNKTRIVTGSSQAIAAASMAVCMCVT